VLNASLAPLANISVPLYEGYQVALDGSQSNAPTQNYTVTSSNPDIPATVAQGQFVTYNISHTASSTPGDISFSGQVVVQYFNDLTPTTATKIEGFVNSGFYNGKQLFRVANGFPPDNSFIIQGGSPNNTTSGVSGLPGTPFANEIVQQLAFTNPGQIAMANTGQPNSNDTQFFFTAGAPSSLNYNFTIFGQVVSGLNIVNDMTQVSLQSGTTTPVSPIVMNTVTTSTTNPNGVIHVNATQARAGETSTITVTATDPTTNTSTSQSFVATVAPNNSATLPLNLQPIAFSATQPYTVNTPVTFQLQGDPANSSTSSNQTLSYTITTPPTNGTLSTPTATGMVTYTPNSNSQANDSFQFTVTNSGAKLTSNPATVTLTTTPAPAPTAAPVSATSQSGSPVTIQLQGSNPGSGNNQAISFSITTPPTKGTLSTPTATGSVTYTPTAGASGTDSFQYTVTNVGPPAPGLASQPATVTVNLANPPVSTGAVRQIGNVLVVTPPPGDTANGKNTIDITELTNATDSTQNTIQVFVNGKLDILQPLATSLDRIVAYGSKAGDNITVDPSVDPNIVVTLDGGHSDQPKNVNVLQAGAGPTLEHGWFGKNTLIGGTGTNELIGRAGHVKFRPTTTTDVIFAGVPHGFQKTGRRVPPGGTFFKRNNKGKLVPIPTPPITPDFQDATVPTRTTKTKK
jgi:cyclophilin family peptidyl-prolyl cis-trans isomerase